MNAAKRNSTISFSAYCLPQSIDTGTEFSRKGAKAQSAIAFARVFFAPLRLCARELFSNLEPFEWSLSQLAGVEQAGSL
jgi:hypothetical protein